ncbi:MAG: methionine--tRNA ligase, partial [Myxococcales bacterium]|nr:methionine--tRNA ligase [Myxococcales bacterium]
MSSFYVTTPIYYVNGTPHIGHAYTTLVADTLARYHRQRGDQVFFMTGTDEHGLKVQREAERRGMTPQAMADEHSARFRSLFDTMKLSYDRFIRTTEDEHARVVRTLFETLRERGDIYLGEYEGWYAASDEAFYTDEEIQDGKVISTGATVEWVAERSYFFRLSAYRERLLQWYRENPECIRPEARYNEVYSFVEGELHDLSISRTTFDWGIPVPGDPEHVMYVWLDALTNYITGVGAFSDAPEWTTFWPCDVHLIGKDILRFHAVYWPAFLMSAGLPLPRTIFAHGWWLNEGVKMSKSLGNFIDAFELLERAELDVLRYYMLREVSFGNDGNFSYRNLLVRNNSELADNLGNLVNRTLRMTERFLGGVIPAEAEVTAEDEAIVARAFQARDAVEAHMQ